MTLDTLDALRAHYPPAKERALHRQLDALAPHCWRFVAMSPFIVLASRGTDGPMDASSRVNGTARLTVDPARLTLFPRSALPTMGEMLKAQIRDEAPPESQKPMLARYAGAL